MLKTIIDTKKKTEKLNLSQVLQDFTATYGALDIDPINIIINEYIIM